MKNINCKLPIIVMMILTSISSVFANRVEEFRQDKKDNHRFLDVAELRKNLTGTEEQKIAALEACFTLLESFYEFSSKEPLTEDDRKSFQTIYQEVQSALYACLNSALKSPRGKNFYEEVGRFKGLSTITPARCKAVINLIELKIMLAGADDQDTKALQRALTMLKKGMFSTEKTIENAFARLEDPQGMTVPGQPHNKMSFKKYIEEYLTTKLDNNTIDLGDLIGLYTSELYTYFIFDLSEEIAYFGILSDFVKWDELRKKINKIEEGIKASRTLDTSFGNTPDKKVFDMQSPQDINKVLGFYFAQRFIIDNNILDEDEIDEKLQRLYAGMSTLPNSKHLQMLLQRKSVPLAPPPITLTDKPLLPAPDLSGPLGFKELNSLLLKGVFENIFIDQISNPTNQKELYLEKIKAVEENAFDVGPTPLPGPQNPAVPGWSTLQKVGVAGAGIALVAAIARTVYVIMWNKRIRLSKAQISQKAYELAKIDSEIVSGDMHQESVAIQLREKLLQGLTNAEVQAIENELAQMEKEG